jgi:hypothetical protein
MKRTGVVWGLTLSIALLLCTLSVLIRPVFAQECTANCRGGGKVTCYGQKCSAKDNEGCRSWDQNGTLIIDLPCSAEMEIL